MPVLCVAMRSYLRKEGEEDVPFEALAGSFQSRTPLPRERGHGTWLPHGGMTSGGSARPTSGRVICSTVSAAFATSRPLTSCDLIHGQARNPIQG